MGKGALGVSVVLAFCGSAVSLSMYRSDAAKRWGEQTAPWQSPSNSGALINKDVLTMVKAGLPSEVIVAKIKSSACDFDTSPNEFGDLKKAGLPDGVILAMVQALTARSVKQREVSAEPSVDQILAKYIQALGGKAAIERQTQFVSRGSWESEVKSGTVEVYGKAPNRMLTLMDVPGFGQIRDGFDGSVAWHEDPQVGVQEINGRESSAIRRMAEFYGDLKLRQLYPKIITKGKQNVGQRAAYVVEADSGDGLFRRMYFDTQIGLLLRDDTEYDTPEGRASVTRYFDDYRDVDAVKVTFTVRQSDKNGSLTFRLTESRFDVALDDAVFARPTAGTTIGSEAPPELPVTSSISAAAQSEQSGTTPTARGVNEGLAVM